VFVKIITGIPKKPFRNGTVFFTDKQRIQAYSFPAQQALQRNFLKLQ